MKEVSMSDTRAGSCSFMLCRERRRLFNRKKFAITDTFRVLLVEPLHLFAVWWFFLVFSTSGGTLGNIYF